MNLSDAINSGRPFKRPADHEWWVVEEITGYVTPYGCVDSGHTILSPTRENLLAEDWEILEPAVQITRTQLLEAYAQLYCEPRWDRYPPDPDFANALAERLGLGVG